MARVGIETVPKEEYLYLWYPYVPFGVPSIFQGQAGYGKTTLLCRIMAELSRGIYPPRLVRGTIKGRETLTEWQQNAVDYMKDEPHESNINESTIQPITVNGMEVEGLDDEDETLDNKTVLPMDRPFMRPCGKPIKSAYISRENHYGNIIRAKYEEYGGRDGYLSIEDESDEPFTTTVGKIRRLTGDAKLVVVDPIFPFIEGRLSNNDDVARAMRNFEIVARETGAAFILLNNLTKGGSSDIDAGIGASNLKNIARSLFKIDRDGPALFIEGVKNNIAPYRGRVGLLFDQYGRIDYINYSQLETATSEYASSEATGQKRQGKELHRAIRFLEDMLANGPVEHSLIKQKAEEAGISLPTLNRAKRQCGRTSKRVSRESSFWK
ncbi:MAG: hypothetical protein IKM73_17960 [Acidaminococcaceae bacterium]|nr:hypothetical protein [Acidaminococcaceae bacterium]